MLMFILAISCLTTSNLPWFKDLTSQVPMQHCSLQHQTLLPSPVMYTNGCCFCFGCTPSFFLDLFLHWSPLSYWAPTNLGSSSFSVLSFCLFILFIQFLRQEYWSGLPFLSPVEHILSDLSTMWCLSWVAPTWHGCFIELNKAVAHVLRLASCLWLWFQAVCSLMPSCSAYHLTCVSLTLDMGYLFIAAPAKHSHCSLPWTWVAPLGHCPWPWTWCSSSQQCFCAIAAAMLLMQSLHQVAKILELQLQHQSFLWISGLISFRTDWFDFLAVQGALKSLLQHHISKASILWYSACFMVQLSHPYMTSGRTIALTSYMDLHLQSNLSVF